MTFTRRLLDYPAVADLEHRSILNANLMADAARWDPDTGIEAATLKLFGITTVTLWSWIQGDDLEDDPQAGEAADADEEAREQGYFDLSEELDAGSPVEIFARYGWDVTDGRGKPLRMLGHYKDHLAAAITGVAGATLPGAPLAKTEDWAAVMERDARIFRPSGPEGKR